MTSGSTSGHYTLANSWVQAKQRLGLLELLHDADTMALAGALGVGPGWRCLEAGAGSGSIARQLAARVGDTGSVLAVDRDTHLLVDSAGPNLQVQQLDLVRDELPTGEFDFVHARLVLMHLPARDRVLARLTAALRPGGVLLLEDYDFANVRAMSTGAVADVQEAVIAYAQAHGARADYGRELPARLDAAGLIEVAAAAHHPIFRGGGDFAQFTATTWLQLREGALGTGIDPARFDAGVAALADPASWFHGPAMVAAWGTKATEDHDSVS